MTSSCDEAEALAAPFVAGKPSITYGGGSSKSAAASASNTAATALRDDDDSLSPMPMPTESQQAEADVEAALADDESAAQSRPRNEAALGTLAFPLSTASTSQVATPAVRSHHRKSNPAMGSSSSGSSSAIMPPKSRHRSTPSSTVAATGNSSTSSEATAAMLDSSSPHRPSRMRKPSQRTLDLEHTFASPSSLLVPVRTPRASASGSGSGGRRSAASAATAPITPGASGSSSNAQLDRLREERISQVRAELEQVHGDHDGLLRELFHLEKFVTYIGYDPEEAAKEKSNVWLQFQAKHDLTLKAAAQDMTTAGRATRRIVSARMQDLALRKPSPPQRNLAAASPSQSPAPQHSQQQQQASRSSAKGKARAIDEAPRQRADSSSTPFNQKKRRAYAALSSDSDSEVEAATIALETLRRSHKKGSAARYEALLAELKRRKSGGRGNGPILAAAALTVSPKVEQPSRQVVPSLPAAAATVAAPSPLAAAASVTPAPAKRSHKKKLVDPKDPRVLPPRKPGPLRARYLSPAHLPRPATHGGNVQALWRSFNTAGGFAEGWEEVPRARLEAAEESAIDAWLRIDRLRLEGVLPSQASGAAALKPPREPLQPSDTWHTICASHIAPHAQRLKADARAKATITRKITKAVTAYWDERLGRGERQLKAEERRVKGLAKWTAKQVAMQWKLAVNVIKARKARVEREELQRLGKKQLKELLEESTTRLERQRGTFEKGVEMSESESEEEEDEESGGEEQEQEQEQEEQEEWSQAEEEEDDATDAQRRLLQRRAQSESASIASVASGPAAQRSFSPESAAGSQHEDSAVAAAAPVARSSANVDALLSDKEDEELEEEANGAIDEAASPAPHTNGNHVANGHSSPVAAASSGAPKLNGKRDSASAALPSTPPAPAKRARRLYEVDSPCASPVIVEVQLPRSSSRASTAAPAASPDSAADLQELQSQRQRRSSESSSSAADVRAVVEEEAAFAGEAKELVEEDEALEREMWNAEQQEKELDDEDSDEDAGLEADADLPIEELMKRYGYGTAVDQGDDDDEEEEEEESEEEGSVAPTERSERAAPLIVELDDDEAQSSRATSAAPSSAAVDMDIDGRSSSSSSPVKQGGSRSRTRARSSRSRTRASSAMSTDAGETPAFKIRPPFLLRGNLRPYQQIGFEWLATLYENQANGILADEMGLGKTIQTISLLAHLACDKGVWGPHLIVVPTSVMLNWEVEFKKFLPAFKILTYYGSQRERKEKRKGWNTEGSFNVCITSYQIVISDQHIFRRKPWCYLVLDEAHHIKNFRSQRWQTLLGFNAQRRLLLTGTPLQNNLMDLWSLMYFLMPNGMADESGGGAFASMKDFQAWFSNPLDRAVESGERMDEETKEMVGKLHTLLRPYLLRRLKKDVEKELPSKFEHVVYCRLSKRQRFLYNDFMSRAKTRESLASGNYLSVINVLMQLRKVCNHPDLFEVRPIVTSFASQRAAVADYEVKELLVRRELQLHDELERVNLAVLNLDVAQRENLSPILTQSIEELDASAFLPHAADIVPTLEPLDTWTIEGMRKSLAQRKQAEKIERWHHVAYLNRMRCARHALYGASLVELVQQLGNEQRLLSAEFTERDRRGFLMRCDNVGRLVHSYDARRVQMQDYIDRFAFVTPRAVAVDMPRWALPGLTYETAPTELLSKSFDTLHKPAVKLHIAFPDASLLQYDCGKLQQLDILMRQFKASGQRVLIFTQMTKVLDILESFLNWRGYRYFRLDGATKVEQRQILTERFNRDPRITAFILSTRSGGLGLNLTGASNVCFFDLDWSNASMSQAIDRAHRIGQQRDVHIYSLVSEHTIEENMLRRVRQKRQLDDLVVQDGDFTTDHLARVQWRDLLDEGGTTLAGVRVGAAEDEEAGATDARPRDVEGALLAVEDEEDAQAARATREEMNLSVDFAEETAPAVGDSQAAPPAAVPGEEAEDEEEGGTIDDYMLTYVERDWEHFSLF